MGKKESAADKEAARLKQLLTDYGVESQRIDGIEPIIVNTAWMKIKLDAAREEISESGVVIPYDNGGGQSGLRENPLFKGYESLYKSYMAGMKVILDHLPQQAESVRKEEIEKPKTMLELVRDKHKKDA